MAPEVYGPYVVYENGNKVLYVQVLKALYGMLVVVVFWYKKFRADLEEVGFVFNPYDPCVANRQVNGKQQTICFDVMSSHIDLKTNNKIFEWFNRK